MRIRDLFRSPTAAVDAVESNAVQKKADTNRGQNPSQTAKDSEDTVKISPLARQFKFFSELLSEDDTRRQDRVSELKKKVEAGEYQVDSEDVAKSIVSFAQNS